ncbi:MAG: ABC-type nitrate/sulfonate/bicarbonate transport system, permease component [Actinomycetia bacterium]|nr:ABC-type nitrate/sulfonate/bicarbonate transport system, permease component [Actinomycetes bacterium]
MTLLRDGAAGARQASGSSRRLRRAARGAGSTRQPWWTTAASIVGGIVIWQLVVSLFHPNPLAIVGPWDTLTDAVQLARAGTLGADVLTSLEEFFVGMVIAIAAGLLVGFCLGLSRRASAIFDPWVTVLYTVPVIAVAPLIVVALGLGTDAKIVIVAASAFFPIAINCQAGARQVDRGLRDVCLAFGASRAELFRYALLRGTAPYLLTGIRLALGRGLIGVVAGDLFGSTKGLGFLILSGQQNLRTNDLYVGVAVLSIIGLILTGVVGLLERRYTTLGDDQ